MNEDEMSTAQSTALSPALRAQGSYCIDDSADCEDQGMGLPSGCINLSCERETLVYSARINSYVCPLCKAGYGSDEPRGLSASEPPSSGEAVTNNSEPSP